MVFHFGSMIFLFDRFCLFFSSFPCMPSRARESDVWLYRWSWEFHEWNIKLCSYQIRCSDAAPCGMFDVKNLHEDYDVFTLQLLSNLSPDTASVVCWAFFELLLSVCKSQNLARLHEIAKISTRKIIAIPKSQNFVLANNSNNKVTPGQSGWLGATAVGSIPALAFSFSLPNSLSQKKSASLGLAEGSGAKFSHVLTEASHRQESEKTASFVAWLGHWFRSLFQHVTWQTLACSTVSGGASHKEEKNLGRGRFSKISRSTKFA